MSTRRTGVRVRRSLPAAAAILAAGSVLSAAACADALPEPIPVDPEEHAAAVAAFAAAREAELAAPDSWLALTGLHWLEDGETAVGSAPESGIVLRPPAVPRVGTVTVAGERVFWRTEPGARVTEGVDSTLNLPAGTGAIPPDVSGDPEVAEADLTADLGSGRSVVLRHGDLNWIVVRRDGRFALRTRDNAHPAYAAFRGVPRYPASPAWRVTALWVPHDKTVQVPNVLGTISETPSPAALVFELAGQRLSLDVTGALDHGRTMLVFADATSGSDTYGGGRYLWVDGPDEEGRVVVDFNYAFSPPCVWTPFATCPLPTRENRLPVRVEAGERVPATKYAPDGG